MEIRITIEDAEAARWLEAVAQAIQKGPAKAPKARKPQKDLIEEITIETRPEDEAQDAADEAALSPREPGKLTREDLRNAFTRLSHPPRGVPYAMANIERLIGGTVDSTPEEGIAEAIAKIEADIARTEAAVQEPEPVEEIGSEPVQRPSKTFTRQDVIDLAKEYAATFDGPVPLKDAKIAMADVPVIIERVAGVRGIAQIPEDPYLFQAVAEAIETALRINPFNRQRH